MRRTPLALSLLTVLATSPIGAQAVGERVVSTFSEYSRPTTTEFQATPGAPVTSGVLDFYETFGAATRNVLATWGTDPSLDPYGAANRPANVGSSTAMWSTQSNSEIDILGHGSDIVNLQVNFDLISIDVAHLFSQPNVPSLQNFNLTFFGTGNAFGSTVIQQTFTITAPPVVNGARTPVLQTLTFDNRWRGLNNVWWNQPNILSQQHQFTNVTAALAAPEPSTWVLMLTGLGGVVLISAMRRRRA